MVAVGIQTKLVIGTGGTGKKAYEKCGSVSIHIHNICAVKVVPNTHYLLRQMEHEYMTQVLCSGI